MSRKDDQQCKKPGCQKGGFFHGYCKRHFPEAYGMSWEDYLKNRAFRGEKPHLVATRIKGLDTSKLSQGKVESVKEIGINGQPLSKFLGVEGSLKKTAPGIEPAAVVIPQDLWGEISSLAETESRTPEQQVLHMLHLALREHQPVTRIMLEISDQSLEERIMRLIATNSGLRRALKG